MASAARKRPVAAVPDELGATVATGRLTLSVEDSLASGMATLFEVPVVLKNDDILATSTRRRVRQPSRRYAARYRPALREPWELKYSSTDRLTEGGPDRTGDVVTTRVRDHALHAGQVQI